MDISSMFYLLAFIFLTLTLIFNITPKSIRVPGDLYIERFGINIYIPFVSAIIISSFLILMLNFFRK